MHCRMTSDGAGDFAFYPYPPAPEVIDFRPPLAIAGRLLLNRALRPTEIRGNVQKIVDLRPYRALAKT